MLMSWDREAFFDPQIIARNLPAWFILKHLDAAYSDGMTDEDIYRIIPRTNLDQGSPQEQQVAEEMKLKILSIMHEVRDLGILRPVPHGAERGIEPAQRWNEFVETGKTDFEDWGTHDLLTCPLPFTIERALWSEAFRSIADLRVSRGYTRSADYKGKDEAGESGPMPVLRSDLPNIAAAAAHGAMQAGSGMMRFIGDIESMPCLKTGIFIRWKPDEFLSPSLVYRPHGSRDTVDLEPFVAPKPLRHLTITLPSGILMAADQFRLHPFRAAMRGQGRELRALFRIDSDKGVDDRTRDFYERLGLMVVPTTNCVPSFVRDGDAIRVGHFDADAGSAREVLGNVCCDAWNVTFADREILIDIMMAGAKAMIENRDVQQADPDRMPPVTREEAAAQLDDLMAEEMTARIEFEPGTTLHIYMATGREVETFAECFSSEELSDWPFMEDMFVLSTEPLKVDPDLVDEADWSWPDRYRTDGSIPAR